MNKKLALEEYLKKPVVELRDNLFEADSKLYFVFNKKEATEILKKQIAFLLREEAEEWIDENCFLKKVVMYYADQIATYLVNHNALDCDISKNYTIIETSHGTFYI